jgi:GntR family transcriptional regulator
LAARRGRGIAVIMTAPGTRDAIPLYHQIFLALRDEILSGHRAAGALLPTEHELAALHGVSRITARKALGELAAQGLVERRRRAGTRVAATQIPTRLHGDVNQTLDALIAFGRGTRVEVLEHGLVAAEAGIAAALGIVQGSTILRAVRLRSDAGGPLGVVDSFVPDALAAGLSAEALMARPLLELVRDGGHRIGGGHQTISAENAGPDLAALLGTEPRAAILCVERLVHDPDGHPLLLTRARYRGDRYHLGIALD